ncbi:transposase [Streptomyces sp. GTA36]
MGEVEYARYTYELPVSSTALALLEAERSRCRRVWNECVAMSPKVHRPQDKSWLLFGRVTPPTEVMRAQRGGGPVATNVLAAIIFVATSGCTWRQRPPALRPSRQTVHRRFTHWSRARVRATLHRVILGALGALGARSELDRPPCAIASISLRAAKECKTGRGSHCRWAPRPPTCTTARALSRSCAASRSLLRAVLRRAVAGRPPLHRAAASALKCPSEQRRNAFAPGGNSGAISKAPLSPPAGTQAK